MLFAFSSCRRFSGEFRFNRERLQIVLKGEGISVRPGDCLELEDFFCEVGKSREMLLALLAEEIGRNHPKLPFPEIPFGWCSMARM